MALRCRRAGAVHSIINPSAPVLFFGDCTAYQKSPLRIATVGLNPSWREFPVGKSFSRFSGADSAHIPTYLTSLERYFRTNPYKQWFNSYENVLCGLDASYYGEKPNTVLHTDIGSVLPTKPTWSDLGHNDQKSIADVGVPLWHRLIAYLQPQIILWSTAKIWLDRLNLNRIKHIAPGGLYENFARRRAERSGGSARLLFVPAGINCRMVGQCSSFTFRRHKRQPHF
jgi:hypothetical protein